MGKDARPFVNKNDPASLSFLVVSASQEDPRFRATESHALGKRAVVTGSTLRRMIPPNLAKKGAGHAVLPKSLRQHFEPEDFGIHANLSENRIEDLCRDVYGYIPEDVIHKLQDHINKAANPLPNIDADIFERAECYFPLDGYDYEQHLSPICAAAFVPVRRTVEPEPVVKPFSEEEQIVLDALDHAEDFDELSDDFVVEVGTEDDEVHKTLWGRRNNEGEMAKLLGRSEEEKRAIDDLLNAVARDSDSEVDSDEKVGKVSNKDLMELLAEEYDEADIGELDPEDENRGTGEREKRKLEIILNQFEGQREKKTSFPLLDQGDDEEIKRDEEEVLENEETNNKEPEWFIEHKDEDQFDCESVLSTRSNLYNHPTRIIRPEHLARTLAKIASGKTPARVLEAVQEKDEEASGAGSSSDDEAEGSNVTLNRIKGESKEKKKARKTLAKEGKRLAREAKKESLMQKKDAAKKETHIKQSKNPYDVQEGVRRFRI